MVVVIFSSVIFAAGISCWICSLILRKSNKIGKKRSTLYDSTAIHVSMVKSEDKFEEIF